MSGVNGDVNMCLVINSLRIYKGHSISGLQNKRVYACILSYSHMVIFFKNYIFKSSQTLLPPGPK